MEIKTKYDFGDKVFFIVRTRKKVIKHCPFCAGKGKITGADDKTRSCPECYDRRTVTEWLPTAWQITRAMTVGEVRVEVTNSPGIPDEEMFDNYKPQKGQKEQYMCIETGIGSGSLYNVEKLFPTKEEAQAECDKLNAEEEKNNEKET